MSGKKWLARSGTALALVVGLAIPLTVAPKPAEAYWWRGGGGWGGWHGGWGGGWGWHGGWGVGCCWRGPGWGWGWRGGVYVAPPVYAVPPPVYAAPPPYYYAPSAYVPAPSVSSGSPLAGGNGGYGQHPSEP